MSNLGLGIFGLGLYFFQLQVSMAQTTLTMPKSLGNACNPIITNSVLTETTTQNLLDQKISELPQRGFDYDYYSSQKTGFRGIIGLNVSTGFWNGFVNEYGDRLGYGVFAGLQFDFDHIIFNRNSQFLVGLYFFNTTFDSLNGPLNPFNSLYKLEEVRGTKRNAVSFTWIKGWWGLASWEAAISTTLTIVQPVSDPEARVFVANFPQLTLDEKKLIPNKKVAPTSEFRFRLAPVLRKTYPGTFWSNYFEMVFSVSAGLEWGVSLPAVPYTIKLNTVTETNKEKESLIKISSLPENLRYAPQMFLQFSVSYQNIPF